MIGGSNGADWDAIRAEYVAGGIGQRALAAKYGVSHGAVERRSAAEGWVRAREDAARAEAGDGAGAERGDVKPVASNGEARSALEGVGAERAGGEEKRLFAEGEAQPEGNAEIASRLRRKLLARLERVADATADEMVTEVKTQDASGTRLFKLRDLTAAYKDLAGDLARGEEADVEDLSVLEELLRE